MDDRAFERGEELGRRGGRHGADDAAGHQESEGVDRVGRVGNQHDVARRGDRLGHVGEAFLRAERGDDLGLGIELHAEPARVIAGLGAAQAGDAFRGGVPVGARLADRFNELVEHVLGRGQIGVAHAEIDNVGAGGAGLGLQHVDLLEDVRRQAPHPVKVAHRGKWPLDRFRFRRRRADLGSVSTGTLSAANESCYCWAFGAVDCCFFFAASCSASALAAGG